MITGIVIYLVIGLFYAGLKNSEGRIETASHFLLVWVGWFFFMLVNILRRQS